MPAQFRQERRTDAPRENHFKTTQFPMIANANPPATRFSASGFDVRRRVPRRILATAGSPTSTTMSQHPFNVWTTVRFTANQLNFPNLRSSSRKFISISVGRPLGDV